MIYPEIMLTEMLELALPQNQITFEMLTGTGHFDVIEAQRQCPPLLHEQ